MCKFLSKQLLTLFYLSDQFFFSSLICDHDFTSIFILFTTFILTATNASSSHEPHGPIRSPDPEMAQNQERCLIDFTEGSEPGWGRAGGWFSVQLDCNMPSDKKPNKNYRQPNQTQGRQLLAHSVDPLLTLQARALRQPTNPQDSALVPGDETGG